jgi:hypothetical protein
MRYSKTTMTGTAAGVCFALAQTPHLPHWLQITFDFGAALAVLMLGRSASDCPKNCPGTDEDGTRRPHFRQIRLPIAGLAVPLILALAIVSCVTPNPQAGPDAPDQPAYVISPSLTTTSNAVHQVARTVDQVAGGGGLAELVTAGIFALAAGASGLYARHKSKTTAAMADIIVKAGSDACQIAHDHTVDTPQQVPVRTAMVKARTRQLTRASEGSVDSHADKR